MFLLFEIPPINYYLKLKNIKVYYVGLHITVLVILLFIIIGIFAQKFVNYSKLLMMLIIILSISYYPTTHLFFITSVNIIGSLSDFASDE